MSSSVTIDARGLSCPQPVLVTKKAIEENESGRLEILVDTATSKNNVARFGKSRGWKEAFEKTSDGFMVILEK